MWKGKLKNFGIAIPKSSNFLKFQNNTMNDKTKTIESIISPPPPHMVGDGFRVHNFFPNSKLIDKKRMSPFFLLDYNSINDVNAGKFGVLEE